MDLPAPLRFVIGLPSAGVEDVDVVRDVGVVHGVGVDVVQGFPVKDKGLGWWGGEGGWGLGG